MNRPDPGGLAIPDPLLGTSQPDRFWSVTNIAEATPDLLTPLCWAVWEEPPEVAWRQVMCDFGVLARREVYFPGDPNQHSNGCFYGRQALNVDELRRVLARLPFISPDDVERDLLGSVRPGLPREPAAPARLPVVAVKTPLVLLRTHRRLRRGHAESRSWWRAAVTRPGGRITEPASALESAYAGLLDARSRFGRAFHLHVTVRFLLQSAHGAVRALAARTGDPGLADSALAGYGGVAETQVADDLWRLSRDEITLDGFLAEHGFHGPNEGNPYARSWREDPAPVRSLAETYRRRREVRRPRLLEESSIARRLDAEARLLARTPPPRRPLLRFLLRRAACLTRDLELGKAGYLMCIDGCRAAARRLGAALVALNRIDEIDDVFFLTLTELDELRAGLRDTRSIVKRRREQRTEYLRYRLPVTFHGMPVPVEIATPMVDRPARVTGIPVGGGRAEGRARVVLDAGDDVRLDDGDILVCRLTDPSWAPLFTLAEALVIDIGGAASHGAVVARELGIPCVIGTGDGTATIRDGDHLVVDGDTGVVRITRPDEPDDRPAVAAEPPGSANP
jgi:pyruvate,water dikinase